MNEHMLPRKRERLIGRNLTSQHFCLLANHFSLKASRIYQDEAGEACFSRRNS